MDKQNKVSSNSRKETPDSNLVGKSDSSDHNYSNRNNETASTSSSTKPNLNNSSNVSSSNNKDNDEFVVSQGRPKKRLKGNTSNENVTSSSSIKSINTNDQVSSASSSSNKKSTFQRNHQNKKEASSSSSTSINQISSTNSNKDNLYNLNKSINDKMDADQSNLQNSDNDYTSSTTNDNNKKTTLSSTASSSSKDNNQTVNESAISFQNLPRVPPLRIVISNSTSNKKDNSEKLVSSSSNLLASVSLSNSAQIHSTSTTIANSEKLFSIDNPQANSMNTSMISSTTAITNTSSSITTTSSMNQTTSNLDDLEINDENASSSTKDLSNLATSTGRITRSQRAAAQQSTNSNEDNQQINSYSNRSNNNEAYNNESNSKELRKRKNRFKANTNSSNQAKQQQHLNEDDDNDSTSSSNSSVNNKELSQLVTNQLQCLEKKQFQMPSYNCYHLYLNIRRQVDHRRTQQIHLVHPKIPENFNQFLFNTGSYLLDKEGNKFSNNNQQSSADKNKDFILSLKDDNKNLEVPPNLIGSNMHSLFLEQDLERRKLSLQHRIERDKLRLSAEQEILRVYARAEHRMANLNLPLLSACTVLKDEEIYNSIDEENDSSLDNNELLFNHEPNEFANPSLNNNSTNKTISNKNLTSTFTDQTNKSTFDNKILNAWLQDVNEKWMKIKRDILLRQKREAESLQAIQKLNWSWKGKELDFNDGKQQNTTTNLYAEDFVPLVKVEDFDLFST